MAVLPLLALTPSVGAATLTVNTLGDAGDGFCDVTCTLRDAVLAADATPEADTITFDLPGAAPRTIALDFGPVIITEALTIQGPGAASLTIADNSGAGCGVPGLFMVLPLDPAAATAVTFAGFTLDYIFLAPCSSTGIYNDGGAVTVSDAVVQGFADMNIFNPDAGIVNNAGSVTVSNSTLRDNDRGIGGGPEGAMTVSGSEVLENGIGISKCGGTLTVTGSLVADNEFLGIEQDCFGTLIMRDTTVSGNGNTFADGGGIESGGVTLIADSTIADNLGGYGAGVQVFGSTATISSTTITGNVANYEGGGIANQADLLQVSDSTISGNSSGVLGGGIVHDGEQLQLVNSTVSLNSTAGIGGGLYVQVSEAASLRFVTVAGNSAGIDGGGIYGGNVALLGSIVAGNVDNDPGQAKADCFGTAFTSQGSNLFGTGSDCPVGADDVPFEGALASVLNPILADNGGPTPTHALVANSPALGIADAAACASSSGAGGSDQRGVARPQGLGCDSGAVESDLPPACASPFADVVQTDAACVAIVALANQGVINGYTNGNFGPDDPVQRAQMAAFVVRAFQWQGLPTGPRTFTDFGQLVGELRDASLILANLCTDQADDATCVARGYGNGRFGPNDQVSHAQVISFLARAFAQNENYGWVSRPNATLPYTGVPGVHATDIRTYTFYAGGIPDAPTTQAGWDAPAPREWVALVLYQALQSTP